MMVRKLAAALLGVGVLIPGLANALGLGEIKLNSALSEPLNAEIELVQVRELTGTEILPSLASLEDFRAAGVDRTQMLSDLRFEVIVREKGRSYIKLSSRKPVKEPFLNFLVEVNWPSGRLLREYTLLLDPPIYSNKRAEQPRPAQAASAPRTAQTISAPASSTAPTATRAAPQAQPYQPQAGVGGDSYTISSSDSLWGIAQKLKPSSKVSVQQTMIALQRHNPDAFIDDNINLLRRGQVLRAPTEAQVAEISSQEAISLVAEQNRLWRERIAGGKSASKPEARPVDVSGRSIESVAPVEKSDEGRLKLLSGSDLGSAQSGQGGTDAGTGELRSKLALAEENIDKFKLENDDLKVKMSDLQEQVQTSERVISLKDQQIAALQAKLAELEQKAAQDASIAETVPASPALELVAPEPESVAPAPEALAETAPAEAVTQADEEEIVPVSPDVDFNYEVESSAEESTAEMQAPPAEGLVTEEEFEPVVEAPVMAQPQPAPQPVPATPAVQKEGDLLSQLLANPLYLGIGGGAIVLLLLATMMASRRKKQAEEFDGSDDDDGLTDADQVVDLNMDLGDSADDTWVQDAEQEEKTVPQTADVIGEADIYIAYGRYPQAIEMLERAADKEPERADIRMKLCEVCAEAKEPDTFMTHYRALQALGATAFLAKADALRAGFAQEAAAEPEEDFEQAFAEEAISEPVEPDLDAGSDEDATLIVPSNIEAEAGSDLDFDVGADAGLLEETGAGFISELETPVASSSEEHSLEEGSLDFNLDFDTETAAPPVLESADDNSLDFNLDLTTDGSTLETASVTLEDAAPLEFDSEFSLDDTLTHTASEPEAAAPEADLTLDFDQMEAEPVAPTEEDTRLDFDLDFDVESSAAPALDEAADSFEFDVDTQQDVEPVSHESAPESADESILDSASAAQLADELDFDVDLDVPASSEPEPAPLVESAPEPVAQPAASDFASNAEDELDFLSDADEAATKLDLARAYIDMGDREGARDILDEVMIEGSDNQKQEAKELLMRLES